MTTEIDFIQKNEATVHFFTKGLAVYISVDKNPLAMKDTEPLGSHDPSWLIAVILIGVIGGVVYLHLSPAIDMILRGCFVLVFVGFLQTYIPRREN